MDPIASEFTCYESSAPPPRRRRLQISADGLPLPWLLLRALHYAPYQLNLMFT